MKRIVSESELTHEERHIASLWDWIIVAACVVFFVGLALVAGQH